MVCEKNGMWTSILRRKDFVFRPKGDFVYAEGQRWAVTMGIAVACALAILDDDTIKHPRLEVIFTTEEEVGMEGALALDMSDLRGEYLINIDSEEEGKILTSCAGGMRSDIKFHMKPWAMDGICVKLTIRGLLGGHSGTEIDKRRANANVILGRALYELNKMVNFGVASVNGGAKDNAIPREAQAVICVPEDAVDTMHQMMTKFISDIRNEYKTSDPGLEIVVECTEAVRDFWGVFSG